MNYYGMPGITPMPTTNPETAKSVGQGASDELESLRDYLDVLIF
jgi:hypothetical protein